MLEIIHKIFNFIYIIITDFKYHLAFFIALQSFEYDYYQNLNLIVLDHPKNC